MSNTRNRYVPEDSVVYCTRCCCIHPIEEDLYMACASYEWRPVYWRARKGDLENAERCNQTKDQE